MTASVSYVIRKASSKDVEALVSLGRRTFVDTYAADNDPVNVRLYLDQAYTSIRIQEMLTDPHSTYLLIDADQVLAGFALLRNYPSPPCITGDRPLLLTQFYIDRSWQGQGLGSVLINACFQEAQIQGYDQIWLTVWERNPKAQGFYQHHGFQRVGSCEFTVGHEVQQDWLMSRSIPT